MLLRRAFNPTPKPITVVFGGVTEYTTPGSTTFTVPASVYEISGVCVGGGGSGAGGVASSENIGGGGGATAYQASMSVTPGESLDVVVGSGGASSGSSGSNNGGDTSISRSGTALLKAGGGSGGLTASATTDEAAGGAVIVGSGGNGGPSKANPFTLSNDAVGGGGAGGYSGSGGTGWAASPPTSGEGGGGGGGGNSWSKGGGGGGGVGIKGSGSNGSAGSNSPGAEGGGGGSLGGAGSNASSPTGSSGGAYGGGGGGGFGNSLSGAGGSGAAAIRWGTNNQYPIPKAYIKGAASAGATSVTLPTHVTGDLIIVFAYRDGNTTQPTLPAGFTAISNAAGANTNSATLGYKVAASGSETSGTWTNASAIMAVVIAGQNASPIGGSGVGGTATATVTYPTLTMSDTSGNSVVLCFSGHRSVNTALEKPPIGMLRVGTFVNATCELACHVTDGGVTSFSAKNVSVGGTASGWIAHSVEIKK